MEKEEVGGSAFLELLSAEHPKGAAADASAAPHEAKDLEEMAETLMESFDGRSLEWLGTASCPGCSSGERGIWPLNLHVNFVFTVSCKLAVARWDEKCQSVFL